MLSTNLIGSLDDAFVRRVHPVYFPFPSAEERKALWRLAFTGEPAIDCEALGERHVLSGGHIHAAARMAAMIAFEDGRPPTMDDAERAVAREFARLGKPVP